ncbi:MAG: gamma-glutamyltransferase [Desulfopila sp.]|nr:gamma-glutamyltransferase [Desulfopila sp.]
MKRYDKAIVASGHQLVSETAATVLAEGGNAFDAVAAAGFTSAVVEQTLTSLGGGGFLLGHSVKQGQELFFDFFVDTPGLGRNTKVEQPHFFPVTVQFSGAPQVFHVGLASVAVPGTAKGLLHIHKRLGRMPLQDVLAPAIFHARGHALNSFQSSFLRLLYPIMTQSTAGQTLYGTGENYAVCGEQLVNSEMADFLELLAKDEGDSFYRGDIAAAIVADMEEKGGLLTSADLSGYRVMERRPLQMDYRGAAFYTAPLPSVGGSLIALSLSRYASYSKPSYRWGSRDCLQRTFSVMEEVEQLRRQGIMNSVDLNNFSADDFGGNVADLRLFSRGTTHISIADKEGNCAAMTCSNGEGSGYFAPSTGVMLNNMMGEDDLHPDGFHCSPPGQRVASMMSPSMLVRDGAVELVIGSGGSKRIRTAITQVLNQVVDFGRGLQEAVSAPRMYLDEHCLQVEPGFPEESLRELGVDINIWQDLDVYFGGVHAVIPGREGAGDPRRGGFVTEI